MPRQAKIGKKSIHNNIGENSGRKSDDNTAGHHHQDRVKSQLSEQVDIVSSHATATEQGDIEEATALRAVFGNSPRTAINNTKSFIGHAMGAAGALELLGNLPSFDDGIAHATINLDNLDERCALPNLVVNHPRDLGRVDCILNNSFGMLGINSVLIVRRFEA